MKLATRRPGTSTRFIDATSGEDILQVATDENGLLFMAYRLYDASGSLVAESVGLERCSDGVKVHCAEGELLLEIPIHSEGYVHYRLYNSDGRLLTASDGARTTIYPLLRMESVGRHWIPPEPVVAASA
jgi:hypothetical protein